MAAITQTITIVDKSNKVVSASKQLKGVFAEAKSAYLTRKAEIKAEKRRKEEVELQKAIRACSIAEDEARSEISSRTRGIEGPRNQRRQLEHSRSFRAGSESPPSPGRQISLGQFNEDLYGQDRSYSQLPSPAQELQRRHSDESHALEHRNPTSPPNLNRSLTAPEVDLDLAYGEYHEADLIPSDYEQGSNPRAAPQALVVKNPDKQLSGLVLKCKGLLEEADCAGQSVKAIITHLQANPDAMAAVALTLAEISNLAAKAAPGALTALKGTAPAVMALLASPEFLVAVGVGVGITVVMFGGYKIIKKIKASTEARADGNATPQVDLAPGGELLDVKELDRIEKWRRGIADVGTEAEARSVVSGYSNATSVEGEFITPFAAQSMGHLPLPKDKSKKSSRESGSKKDKEGKEKKRHRRKHRDSSERDSAYSDNASSSKSDRSSKREISHREVVEIKKPSPLRRMFTVAV